MRKKVKSYLKNLEEFFHLPIHIGHIRKREKEADGMEVVGNSTINYPNNEGGGQVMIASRYSKMGLYTLCTFSISHPQIDVNNHNISLFLWESLHVLALHIHIPD